MVRGHSESDAQIVNEQAVEKLRAAIGQEEYVYDMADFFKMLGDSTRMRILNLLTHGEACVNDIAAILDMTMSAVSHQLRALRGAKLVKARRDGKNVYYALDDLHVSLIIDMGLAHMKEEHSDETEL